MLLGEVLGTAGRSLFNTLSQVLGLATVMSPPMGCVSSGWLAGYVSYRDGAVTCLIKARALTRATPQRVMFEGHF